ncbi:MAG: transporter substrate-binding domain-containing protein [Candidatus Dependentiae bacterium]
MNKKNILLMSIFIGLFTSFYLFKSKSQNNLITIGTAAAYAPFVSINEQGKYEGFDIDVADALARQMGKKLVVQDMGSMTALFMALEQGKVDAVIWALSITEERLDKVAMINYQGEKTKTYPLLFWKKIPENIKSIEDMQGMTICVEPTSAQDTVAQKYTGITLKPTENVDDALLNIQFGKVQAAFVEPAIAQKFKKKYPEIQVLDVELAPEDQVQGMGIAIKKGNTEVINQIQRAVDELKSKGVISTYEAKWGIS